MRASRCQRGASYSCLRVTVTRSSCTFRYEGTTVAIASEVLAEAERLLAEAEWGESREELRRSVALPGVWPNGVAFPIYFQFWVQDPAGPAGFSATNGLQATPGS